MIILLFGGQLRVSELLNLKRDDLKWTDDVLVLSIRCAKNDQEASGRQTSLRMGAASRRVMDTWLNLRAGSGHLFPGRGAGEGLSYPAAVRDLQKLAKLANVPYGGSHAFRRGATSEAIEAGTPLHLVQRRGRWTSVSSVESYIQDSVSAQGGFNVLP